VPLLLGSNRDETSRAVPAIASEDQYQAAVLALAGNNNVLANAILAVYPARDYSSPRAAYVALTTDAKFTCPARAVAAAAQRAQQQPVFRYHFSQALDGSLALRPFGAWHGIELFWVFSRLNVAGYMPTQGELALADYVGSYWTQFASVGDP